MQKLGKALEDLRAVELTDGKKIELREEMEKLKAILEDLLANITT